MVSRTPVTYQTVKIAPTEMWVEGRTWPSYKAMGWEAVKYERPAEGAFRWVDSGRMLIREKDGPTYHTFSLELCALHQAVCAALGCEGIYKPRAAMKEHSRLHSKLFGLPPKGLDYRGILLRVCEGEYLEDAQARVVTALRSLAEVAKYKKVRALWEAIADAVEDWHYGVK